MIRDGVLIEQIDRRDWTAIRQVEVPADGASYVCAVTSKETHKSTITVEVIGKIIVID